jgi:hypothetical protein
VSMETEAKRPPEAERPPMAVVIRGPWVVEVPVEIPVPEPPLLDRSEGGGGRWQQYRQPLGFTFAL